eukprot:COSAG05_NODE_4054_length_1696_cov_3.380088_1_plen_88_part_00
MGKIKEFTEMNNYTETQLLMCEKEDLIEYIKYLRTITPEEEGEMLKHASVEDIQKDITTTRARAIELDLFLEMWPEYRVTDAEGNAV